VVEGTPLMNLSLLKSKVLCLCLDIIGPLPGPLRLMSLPLGNIDKRDPAFKRESANGAGSVLERFTSMMKTIIASVVARRSHPVGVPVEVEA